MQSEPPESFQTTTTSQTYPLASPSSQYGHSTDTTTTFNEQPSSPIEYESSSSIIGEDISPTSSAISRGRVVNTRRLNRRDTSSHDGSSGSRIDAYERANATPRRASDEVVFQVIPSSKNVVPTVSILDFPNEVLTHVLSHLPPETLSMMSLINHRFHKLVTTPPAWRIAFARFFPGSESTGLTSSTSIDSDTQKANRRSFTRVSALASWRSEYILRTRLLRSLARGRPAISASLTTSSSRHKLVATATVMYSSKLMYPISHIHANFGNGLNKKQPLFTHGAVEQGAVSSSDPASGSVGGWGLADFEAFRHFADIYTGEAEYGLGAGDVVGMPNVMDISQPFGKLYGEALPGGRLFYTSTSEQRGRFLMVASTANHALGIPEINPAVTAVTSVWLAKSEAILKVSSGLFGMLSGTSTGILSAYALGANPVYDRRFEKGELTARWAICPGVPIVAIDVDEKISARRINRQRVYVTLLNALGEIYYLTDVPVRGDSRGKLAEAEVDRLAWQTGRSVEWHLVESSRRVASPDPFQLHTIDGSYSPCSSSNHAGLSADQLKSEAQEIEQFLHHEPKHFQDLCEGWDMRRLLLVDYGGENSNGGGEAMAVISRGLEENSTSTVKRFTRHRVKKHSNHDVEQYPLLRRRVMHDIVAEEYSAVSSPSNQSVPRSRTSSTDSIDRALFETTWHQTDMNFGYLKTLQVSAVAIDHSDFAVLSANEDPLLGMSGGSDTSSPLASPFGQSNVVNSAAEIPGLRARLFAIGSTNGTVVLWNIRAPDSPAPDMINTVLPVRIIHTKSPQISSLALTSLHVVHGGNDGLVQAWDPLASNTEPVRTLNSRFSDRARRRIAQAEASIHGVGNNYYAAGAIVLDPDPTMLRGMVSLGTHLRYWSYNAGSVDAYKSKKRGQLRRRSDRGSNLTAQDQKYHHTGRGVLRDYIADETFELEREKVTKRKEVERLTSRFGTGLLGEDASEEEMLAYATMLSEEAYTSDQNKRKSTPPLASDRSSSKVSPPMDADLEEAIRLSLLDSEIAAQSPQTTDYDIPIKLAKSAKHATPSSSTHPVDDDLEFAVQLSLAEQESQQYALEDEFPTLKKSSSNSSVEGKGKGRKR